MNKIGKACWELIEVVVRAGIAFGQRISGKIVSETRMQVILQFIRFCMVGISNSAINYVTYIAALMLLRTGQYFSDKDYMLSQIISFLVSVLWAYYWNQKFVFHKKNKSLSFRAKAILKTYASYSVTGLLLSEILLVIWVRIMGISAYVAPLLNIVICMPINFWLNKVWTFRQ